MYKKLLFTSVSTIVLGINPQVRAQVQVPSLDYSPLGEKGAYTLEKVQENTPYSFEYITADSDGNLSSDFYKITLKDTDKVSFSPVSADDDPQLTIKLPGGDVYYNFEYEQPGNYELSGRIDNTLTSADQVTNKLFKDITSANSGGAIYNYNTDNSSININADFVGNAVENTNAWSYGGAILTML